MDLIVGVPRSGMIPALMLAELLNKRCTDIDSFLEGRETSCGKRGGMMRRGTPGKVLVLDDSSCSGRSVDDVRGRLAAVAGRYDILYGCVYAESEKVRNTVDLFLEDITLEGRVRYLKEWNILHLYRNSMEASMWDIDGLVCKDPPDDRDTAAYERYLPNALPMVIPTCRVGAFVTYRLEKYRAVTEDWLCRHGAEYGRLMMFDAPSREVRNRAESSAGYKGRMYANAPWAQMFFESDPRQAERIFRTASKPVYCYGDGRFFF